MMIRFKFILLFLGLMTCFLSGCKTNTAHVYTLTVDQVSAESDRADAGVRPMTWRLGKEWVAMPADPMTLETHGLSGTDIQFSVTQLSGDAGGLVANLNRWRGQLGLKAVNESEAQSFFQRPAYVSDGFVVLDLLGQKNRILVLVATIQNPHETWFFKLSGPNAQMANYPRSYFENILASIKKRQP